jgi:uncharacterized repeat protein (TIGR01451 family)
LTESFLVNLSTPVNATIADGQGLGTIANDDAPPAIAVNDISVTEGDAGTTNAIFTVILSQVSSQTVTVDATTADGTASASGNDYNAKSSTLIFLPGTTVQYDTVLVTGDGTNEPNETFVLNLLNPSNATIADNQGLCTIGNDDGVPAVAVTDMSLMEGNAGTTEAVFVVTLSAASGQTVTVDFATANGTAAAGADYAPESGTLTFAAGVTVARETVHVAGDELNEADEVFFLNLTSAVNAAIADSQAQATLVNDDALPSLTVNDILVTEGSGTETPAAFAIRLSPVSGRDVGVSYVTANGTAAAPGDYSSSSGTVTFAAGETLKTVVAPVIGDSANEPDETFFLRLLSPLNAEVADSEGVCTIINDDVAGANLALTVSDMSDPVEPGTAVRYRIDVTNAGPDAASGATVRDTLPAGTIYQGATGTGWTCTESGGVVTCTQFSLAVGAAAPIYVNVTAPPSACSIRTCAVVLSSTADENVANNADDEVTTILSAGVDLSISLVDTPDPAVGGGPITFTIVVNNAGASAATNVVVRDVLPAGLTCPTASGDGWSCTMSLGVAICTRASLEPGVSPSITISCTAPSGSGSVSNTASVSAAESDPNMLNNTATVVTVVTAVATSTEAIQNLLNQVQCLVTSGTLSGGNSNALIVKLRAALQAADQAKKLNQLQAFINSVEALVRSGRLSASDGQALIAAANSIISTFAANAFGYRGPSSSIALISDGEPQAFGLAQNYPNPFNPSTNIRFAVAVAGDVHLRVYNALGEEIARLVDGPMPAGTFEVTWTMTGMQSGVYLYRLQAGEYVESKKLILLK